MGRTEESSEVAIAAGTSYVAANRPVPGVNSVFAYSSDEIDPAAASLPHRGLPSASLTMIVAADGPLLCSDGRPQWERLDGRRHTVCLGSLHTRPVYLQRPEHQEGVQIEIHPLAARRLFRTPASALTDLSQEGVAVLGPEVGAVQRRVESTDDLGERVRLVTEWFGDLTRRAEVERGLAPPRPEVGAAWTLLHRSGGTAPVSAVADRIGLSTRHLGTLVRAELGVGTKQLAELIRFAATHARLTRALASGRRPSLSGLAATSGHADHSHLVRDYRRFAGVSPTQWIDEEFRFLQATDALVGADSSP